MTEPVTPPTQAADETVRQYKDEDLVYADPENRVVVGPVEWNRNGNVKPLLMPPRKNEKGEERKGGGKRFYPWGTYKSMRNAYRLEGKQKRVDPGHTLEQVIEKALKEPFWD